MTLDSIMREAHNNRAMETNNIFGNVIYSYTRAQAIADGVLVDLTGDSFNFRPGLNICKEAGIKYPVAMTAASFAKTVKEEGVEMPPGQDMSGRLWDVLWFFRNAAKRDGSEIQFKVYVWNWKDSRKPEAGTVFSEVTLKAVCGPGDTADPVITILMPDED